MRWKSIFELVKETAAGFSEARGTLLAAAIAYRAIFSLAPLLVIAVAVAGWFFGEQAVAGELVAQIEDVVGQEAAVLIENFIKSTQQDSSGVVATVISVGVLFWGASSLFGQLKMTLNSIWGIQPAPADSGLAGVRNFVQTRLITFLLVLVIGLLLLILLAISTALSALDQYLMSLLPNVPGVFSVFDILLLIVGGTLLFALLFKLLPDADITWRDVALGALVTAVLFTLGEQLIGLYLTGAITGSTAQSTYGAAGSFLVLLLWIYYSSMIFLFGAEFTQVYANKFGSQLRPAEDALMIRTVTPVEPKPETAWQPVSPPQKLEQTQETAVSAAQQTARQAAAGLLGLALGLLLAFIGQLWQRSGDE